MTLINDIKYMLEAQFNKDIDEITEETNIVEDLDADSLDIVELIMNIEEKFKIKIPAKDAKNIKTVNDIFNYVKINII